MQKERPGSMGDVYDIKTGSKVSPKPPLVVEVGIERTHLVPFKVYLTEKNIVCLKALKQNMGRSPDIPNYTYDEIINSLLDKAFNTLVKEARE